EGHCAVGDVGEVPDQLEAARAGEVEHPGTEKGRGDEHDPVGQDRACTQQVLDVALAVVRPAQDRGKGEEGEAEGDDIPTPAPRQAGAEGLDGEWSARIAEAGDRVDARPRAGRDDGEAGEGTDDDRVDE